MGRRASTDRRISKGDQCSAAVCTKILTQGFETVERVAHLCIVRSKVTMDSIKLLEEYELLSDFMRYAIAAVCASIRSISSPPNHLDCCPRSHVTASAQAHRPGIRRRPVSPARTSGAGRTQTPIDHLRSFSFGPLGRRQTQRPGRQRQREGRRRARPSEGFRPSHRGRTRSRI